MSCIFLSVTAATVLVLSASTVASVGGLVAVTREARADGSCDLRCSGRRPNSFYNKSEGRYVCDGLRPLLHAGVLVTVRSIAIVFEFANVAVETAKRMLQIATITILVLFFNGFLLLYALVRFLK